MSNPLVMSAWAPGLIGLAFAGSLYGVALGQSIYYARHFPNDSRLIKFMVLVIFCSYRAMEAVHGPVKIEYLGELEIAQDSHSDPAFKPQGHFTSRGIFITVPTNYLITFIVQSFYAHRVWIISGNKKHITIAILFTAILQFGIGGWCTFAALRNGTIEFLYTDPAPHRVGVEKFDSSILEAAKGETVKFRYDKKESTNAAKVHPQE
ncbi:hypothetical protein BU15DRAFT_58885 [Melanogaster broomeanus]|nr:hypothetical protein BU15DRAFT_58885 [Melanogaster broomeanus]